METGGRVMRQRTNEKEKLPAKQEKPACNHFWVIEVANGPSSLGTCKHCGEIKEFLNAFPTFNPLRKNSNPLTLPRLPNVEIDKDNKS